jgi:hypothetical protein
LAVKKSPAANTTIIRARIVPSRLRRMLILI